MADKISDVQTYQINDGLSITVQKGDFGRYIKIQRPKRWISLAASLWKIICERKDMLKTPGNVLYLTKAKRLEVILYNDYRYVSLIEQQPGSEFISRINFKDDEWKGLFSMKGNINAALVECEVCHNMKSPLVLPKDSNRVVETKLSRKRKAKLEEYNLTVENQMGIMCLYCGQETQDDCHCHAFDCFICEPDNFCSKCYNIIVYRAV